MVLKFTGEDAYNSAESAFEAGFLVRDIAEGVFLVAVPHGKDIRPFLLDRVRVDPTSIGSLNKEECWR